MVRWDVWEITCKSCHLRYLSANKGLNLSYLRKQPKPHAVDGIFFDWEYLLRLHQRYPIMGLKCESLEVRRGVCACLKFPGYIIRGFCTKSCAEGNDSFLLADTSAWMT